MKRVLSFILAALLLTASAPAAFAANSDAPSWWAAQDVQTAISLKLVPEALQGDYTAPITRAEFAALVAQVSKAWYPEKTLAQMVAEREKSLDGVSFSDSGDEAVLFSAALGIVEGDGKGNFLPKDPITRQQAAKMLMKAAAALTLTVLESKQNTTAQKGLASWQMPHAFDDGDLLRVWGWTSVTWCYRTGVMQGVGNNSFDPNGGYTREQSILSALRLYYLNGQADKLTTAGAPDYYPLDGDFLLGYEATAWVDSSLKRLTADEVSHIANPNAEYGVIVDNEGVGVTYGHVINRKGERQFTDFYGSEGTYSQVRISGGKITFYIRPGENITPNAPFFFTLDTVTGKIEENVELPNPYEKISPLEIRAESSGWYTLMSLDGQALSETYPNRLSYAGGRFYFGWISDQSYDLLYCDGVNQAKVLYKAIKDTYINNFQDLGGGLFAVQTDLGTVQVIDAYGETFGTVKASSLLDFKSAVGLITAGGRFFTPDGVELYS